MPNKEDCMATIQLQELIPVTTPLGKGYAILVDAGQQDQYWTIALSNGALVTFRQDQIRIARSYTHSRSMTDEQMMQAIGGDDK